MAKKLKDKIREIEIATPVTMNYSVDISTGKKRQKFIDSVKKLIRASLEYKDYVSFLKENMDLKRCVFFNNIDMSSNRRNRLSVEMHHEPFTLQDYVEMVLCRVIDDGERINALDIADEVLKLHYENKVGLVPLSKTIHEAYHNSDKIIIPLSLCYGNYSKFLEQYDKYADDLYDKLEEKIKINDEITPESFDAILTEFTYLNVNGYSDVQKLEVQGSDIA